MTTVKFQSRSLRRDRKALSPAISSVILTSAVVVLLLVTIVFANNFLNSRMAENEFDAMKQFMQTIALQTDDVAWTIGRTQTIRYATRFGLVNFERPPVLRYSIYVDTGSGYVFLANFSTGILLYNMPVSQYSVGNNYHERISPSVGRSFLQKGTSATICHVFVIEKMPMNDGNFIRIVATPSIRMLNSSIATGGEIKNYFKFYLPTYMDRLGSSPHLSQTVTLAGDDVTVKTESNVNKIKIRVVTPNSGLGFDQDFFHFDKEVEEVDVPDGSIIQFYVGEVIVSLGLHA